MQHLIIMHPGKLPPQREEAMRANVAAFRNGGCLLLEEGMTFELVDIESADDIRAKVQAKFDPPSQPVSWISVMAFVIALIAFTKAFAF